MKLDLEERLERVADARDGADWLDVRRRAGRLEREPARPSRRLLIAAAAAVAVALLTVPALGVADRLLSLFGVSEQTDEELPQPRAAGLGPVPYVFGDMLFGYGPRPQKLAAPAIAPLLGHGSIARPSPDGRFVLYHTWKNETPSLRLHDVETGEDVLLERGAQSAAWRRDGPLAYFRPLSRRYIGRKPFVGHVVVRRSWDAEPVTWTPRTGKYSVAGWAGKYLLVNSERCLICMTHEVPAEGIWALEEPGRMRKLPLSSVSAISPDGRLIFGPILENPGQDSPTPFVRVVEVATGRVLAHVDLRDGADKNVRQLLAGGVFGEASWVDDRIVAVASAASVGGLVILRFRNGTLLVDEVIRLDRKTGLGGRDATYLYEPVPLDARGRRIVVRLVALDHGVSYVTRFLTCDVVTKGCVAGKRLPARRWLTVVNERSRPWPSVTGRTG